MVVGGVTGDWQPLATLVRLPKLRELVCPATRELACKLSGSDLFLVDSIATDPRFEHPVQVPDGFPGYALPVPHPKDGQLFVKLRDDPGVVNLASVDTRELPPSPAGGGARECPACRRKPAGERAAAEANTRAAQSQLTMSPGSCGPSAMRKSRLWLLLAAAVATSAVRGGRRHFRRAPRTGGCSAACCLTRRGSSSSARSRPWVAANGSASRARTVTSRSKAARRARSSSVLNWYLKYVAHVQISPNGDRVGRAAFPLPRTVIERSTPYAYRLALNENVDGYSAPYWSWPRWQREIDVLALSGINAVLVERGTDSVLYRTFRDFGYSDAEIRRWLAAPAHQNWQLMGNLCCFGGPLSRALLQKRLHLRAEDSGAPARARHHSGPAGLLRHSAR